jgi:hypothetical protein
VKGLLHPAADEEFAGAVRYYAEIDPDLGVRFYREMERMIGNVCADPERYRRFDPPADTSALTFPMRSFTWRNPVMSGSWPSCT